jgi:hypothetical protein
VTTLLKELSKGSIQADLKTSDGSTAGAQDMSSKPVNVGFSLMRNTINADGQVTGSDVNDYLERAQDLNDEVESVGFAIETDDGDIIKVYVNQQDADQFEQELSKLLGLEGDTEEAINQLAQKFDIVDVVWPTDPTAGEEDPDADLSIDAEITDELPPEEEAAGDEEIIDVPPADETEAVADEPVADGEEEIIDVPRKGELEASTDEDTDEEDELEPVLNDDGTQKLDKDGNPVMRKKKKEDKEPSLDDLDSLGSGVTEEGFTLLGKLAEGAREEVQAHLDAAQAQGNKGKYVIMSTISGDTNGLRSAPLKRAGEVAYFESAEAAELEAARLTREKNRAGATASYKYTPKLVEDFDMTIGSNFLARMNEAKATETDSVKDGMNIPLETGHKQLIMQLKRPIEKKIIALFAMSGIVGRLLKNEPDAIDRVRAAGDMLRKNASAKNAFNDFYNAFGTALGYTLTVPKVTKAELAEKHDPKRGAATQKKLEAVLVALGLPEGLITVKGPGVLAPFIAKAALAVDQHGELKAKLVMLANRLGVHGSEAPEDLADTEADLHPKKKPGKDVVENTVGSRFLSRIDELNPVKSTNPYAKAAIELLRALGVPEEHLSYRAPQLKKGLEDVGNSLKQRSMVDQKIEALIGLLGVKKPVAQAQQEPVVEERMHPMMSMTAVNSWLRKNMNVKFGCVDNYLRTARTEVAEMIARELDKHDVTCTVRGTTVYVTGFPDGGTGGLGESTLNEAFNELEAMTRADAHYFKLDEPAAGPAHMATYPGGNHEETVLTVGIDIQKEGMKTLRVGIDGPFDGELHTKYFTDDEAGYKDALKYANMLRTVNLKQGGRPKGWRE